MLFKTYCATCVGIDAVTIVVEVDMSEGIGLRLVGLPDIAVKESLLRMTTALTSYGYRIPGRKIIFNLAPADIRKEGSGYDLSLAIGLLAVSEQIVVPLADRYILMGELALDGRIRPVAGALSVAVHARESGFQGCIFPKESAQEAMDIEGIRIYGVERLADVIEILEGQCDVSHLLIRKDEHRAKRRMGYANDLKFVKGQFQARRGLEIAAAGGHSLILIGSPGSGKSMLASCLPSILPPMTREESIVTSKIYSVTGNLKGNGLMVERPFRTPHHSASLVSLIGGGANAHPGELSMAHNGVLYLDEIVQFNRSCLDALRQPLEDRQITISRAKYKMVYPCSTMLVASMNPCPCGYYNDGSGKCHCSLSQIENYVGRLSGPMMDRIDLQIPVSPIKPEELVNEDYGESSEVVAQRVLQAREVQRKRFAGEGIFTNSEMNAEQLRKYCRVGQAKNDFLKDVIRKLKFSGRAYTRILKISRTIADLAGEESISMQTLAEAIRYRSLDREKEL